METYSRQTTVNPQSARTLGCRWSRGGCFLTKLLGVEIRWDEKAGLRTGCGVRSQVIDVLEVQIKRRRNEKVSTVVAKQSRNISQQKLTIGLDLGDRNSWYCVLDEFGQIQLEQRVRTNAKALREVFSAMTVNIAHRSLSFPSVSLVNLNADRAMIPITAAPIP
jgi:hypothetical protein